MQDKIQDLIYSSVLEILNNAHLKIPKLQEIHKNKIHFIPTKYRVLGGLLQSMNIQFGNFIEVLMKNLIVIESRYEILGVYSGKKNNHLSLSRINDKLIDSYITECQEGRHANLENAFNNLCVQIFKNSKETSDFIYLTHDIDLLFRDKEEGKLYYLEIKYNDDHDTGKFVDINRKFIKTYAYLISEFALNKHDDLVPILFFFNNKRMKGNIYVPEDQHIYRGQRFFKKFLSTSYTDLEAYLSYFCDDPRNLKIFDKLFQTLTSSYINP
ncbi:HinfI family type II restriction enzyme [Helicobacter suis]|uniref:HinfI family type II restriction enzyme n=1 Tax=Helicobacter suis TaxID=104628 RepID=UPI0013D6B49D|nr:restriction endonuclease [Helicobacter suis]